MSSINPTPNHTLNRLREVRNLLLRLHKALLDSERDRYEKLYGPIQNNGELLRLVIGHEWFNWLHTISQFIVQIDEVLFSKEPVSPETANQLLEQARSLLQPEEEGNTLQQRYYSAIQREPDVAIMHVEMTKLLQA